MISHGDAVAMVSLLYAARADKRDAEATDKAISDALKRYLVECGEYEVYDGEAGLVASLQERQQAGLIDIAAMARIDPELVLALALAGALKADIKVVSTLPQAADAAPYLTAGASTVALLVKVAK